MLPATITAKPAAFDEWFAQATTETQVITFHPASRSVPALLHALLISPRWRTLYYPMTVSDVDLSAFLFSLIHRFSDEFPVFTQQLGKIVHTADTPDDYAEGLRAALNKLDDRPLLLILDECDQAEIDESLCAMLEQLAETLPTHCRLLFNGRELPRLPWLAWLAERRALILCDQEPVTQDFYGTGDINLHQKNNQPGNRHISLQGLGAGSVAIDGETIVKWEGHLPRLMLFFALDRPAVTRAEICRNFWPDLSNDQAANVFYVTKRRLNKAMGVPDTEVLINRGHTYRVNPALTLHYDVIEFVEALVRARLSPASQQAAAWQQVIVLYHQPYLSQYTDPWIVNRRHAYQNGYLEALTTLAGIRKAESRLEQALVLLQRAADDAPSRQDVQRELMNVYIALDRRSDAARQYRKLRRSLASDGQLPEPETERLYADLVVIN